MVIVVTVLSCGAATAFYFSSANAGSNSTPVNPIGAVQAGRAGDCGPAHGGAPVPVVPEANAGLVLIPVVAAIFLFSSRRLWAAKPAYSASGQNATAASEP